MYDSKSKVHRRDVLKSLGTVGLGLQTVGTVGATDDMVTIVTDRKGSVPLRTKEVPKKWREQTLRARKIQKQLKEKYASAEGIVTTGVAPTSSRIHQHHTFAIEVFVDPEMGTDVHIPQSVDGISIRVKDHEEIEDETHCDGGDWCNTNDYDWVPGGAYVAANGSGFSATCKVEYDGTSYLMTSAHPFISSCDESSSDLLEQGISYQKVGYVDKINMGQDWSIVPMASDAEIDGFSVDVLGANTEVSGHVTQSGVDDLISTGEEVHNYGAKTCHTKGVVDGYKDTTYCNNEEYLNFTACTDGGDSGSPHYRTWIDGDGCEWASMIAVHKGSNSSHAYGCAAYQIYNRHDISFGYDWDGTCGGITSSI